MSLAMQGLVIFTVAFIVTYAMVPVAMRLSHIMGAIDYPGTRRVHDHAVPRAGGIAIYAGFLAGVAMLLVGQRVFGWQTQDLYIVRDIDYVLLLTGVSIVFVVGLIDDVSPLSPRSKFAGQILAAVVICMSGVTIGAVRWIFTGEYVQLDWLDWPITIVFIVGFMNIINLIDGLDGLAAGITAITTCGLLYLVLNRGSFTLTMFCLAIIASCMAFLRFNFYPAKVFMGDSGALLLGALLAVVSISGVVRTQSLAVFIVPLVIAGVPLIDTLSAIIRRLRAGEHIDEADMEHVHHRLVRAGFSQRRSVITLYIISALLALAGCTLGVFSGPVRWAVLLVLFVIVSIVVYRTHLFGPVLQHYYRRRAEAEPRRDKNA